MRGSGFLKGVALGAAVSTVVVAATAAVAGNGVGGVFNLGQGNTVDQTTALSGAPVGKPSLKLTNSSTAAGATALSLNVASGLPPFAVNSNTKVAKLNADKLDGFDSTGFLPNQVPLSLSGSTATGAIVSASNSGNANGFQGTSNAGLASGVYGENTGGGYGVGGRTNSFNRGALFGENLGTGPALELHTHGGPPMTVDSPARVTNLNADLLDGLSASAFLPATAKATDADRLDGLDSSQFVQGTGRTVVWACSTGPGGECFPPSPILPDLVTVEFDCSSDDDHVSTLRIWSQNTSAEPITVFHVDAASAGADVQVIPAGGGNVPIAWQTQPLDVTTLLVQGQPGRQTVGTIEIASMWRSSSGNCHYQVQGIEGQA
jgi:hypothetical protein